MFCPPTAPVPPRRMPGWSSSRRSSASTTICATCATFAAEGYAAVSPAIFDRVEKGVELGYTQADIDRAADRMKLDDAKVMLDVEAAAAHSGKKLGIVGYCFGGTVAWWGATRTSTSSPRHHAGTAAASPAPKTRGRTARCRCISARRSLDPDDRRGSDPRRAAEGRELRLHGRAARLRLRRTRQLQQADYELAQQRTLEFFAKHLRGAQGG